PARTAPAVPGPPARADGDWPDPARPEAPPPPVPAPPRPPARAPRPHAPPARPPPARWRRAAHTPRGAPTETRAPTKIRTRARPAEQAGRGGRGAEPAQKLARQHAGGRNRERARGRLRERHPESDTAQGCEREQAAPEREQRVAGRMSHPERPGGSCELAGVEPVHGRHGCKDVGHKADQRDCDRSVPGQRIHGVTVMRSPAASMTALARNPPSRSYRKREVRPIRFARANSTATRCSRSTCGS